jgi:hypothetical protein
VGGTTGPSFLIERLAASLPVERAIRRHARAAAAILRAAGGVRARLLNFYQGEQQ